MSSSKSQSAGKPNIDFDSCYVNLNSSEQHGNLPSLYSERNQKKQLQNNDMYFQRMLKMTFIIFTFFCGTDGLTASSVSSSEVPQGCAEWHSHENRERKKQHHANSIPHFSFNHQNKLILLGFLSWRNPPGEISSWEQ